MKIKEILRIIFYFWKPRVIDLTYKYESYTVKLKNDGKYKGFFCDRIIFFKRSLLCYQHMLQIEKKMLFGVDSCLSKKK